MSSVDLFTGIHKGVRGMLFETALTVQNLDVENPAAIASLIDDIHTVFSFLQEHGEHEDDRIFPTVAGEEPQLAAALDAEHKSHMALAARLEDELQFLAEAATPVQRADALAVVRRSYHDFVAGQLLHMNHEEREMLPATQRLISNGNLAEIRRGIVGSIPPDRYIQWLGWMLPALTPQELTEMFDGLATAPPQFGQMVEAVAADVLPAERWNELHAMTESIVMEAA
ncbi:MAG: hemerythrin domain-containing protein [Bacteroidetes bacterium]|nr:hemerythrin domain-containing protein [Bacteroidota bacterium]